MKVHGFDNYINLNHFLKTDLDYRETIAVAATFFAIAAVTSYFGYSWASRQVTQIVKEKPAIQPMKSPSTFITVFWSILNFIKSIFCCGCCSRAKAIKTDATPEIDPHTLPSSDPFRNYVFTKSNGSWVFKKPDGFKEAFALFQLFGTQSQLYWLPQISTINQRKRKIKEQDLHPLEFLYFLFCNKTLTSYMAHFKQEAAKVWFRKPWEEFLAQNTRNFERKKEKIQSFLPGFCKALALNEEKLSSLAKNQNWEGLITYVFEERKKHFSL